MMARAVGAGLCVAGLAREASAQVRFSAYPFALGIASGEPSDDGFVIWTRLAPEPFNADGAMPNLPVEVSWEVAADEQFRRVLRAGTAMAVPELAHAVHVEVAGLPPGRVCFYRFRVAGIDSPVGRARTLPRRGDDLSALSFVTAGCQRWEQGLFTAWRRIAEEDIAFVFHYGDYIYEYGRVAAEPGGRPVIRAMPDGFGPCRTLADYRRRYGLYKTDPDLQAAHASCVFLPSFDDHEVANNWAGDSGPRGTASDRFLIRRAAAFQAWYEHMPVRRRALPRGPDLVAYRAFGFGRLATLAVLDTRSFRTPQPCGDGIRAGCDEALEDSRTLLGAAQENWLDGVLRAGGSVWQVLAQQVLFAAMDWRSFGRSTTQERHAGDMDKWDGAAAGRERVLAMLRRVERANPVVLTGDAHIGLALDLHRDGRDPASPCIGVEFLATSISSGGDGRALLRNDRMLRADNPHLKFAGNERGYSLHRVTPRQWQADFRVVPKVSVAGSPVLTRKSLVVEAGRPGLVDA
ncbi:MAG: alkaline phosphatase D family protein [Phreatobacter sp.]|nr:alkaline phosphatase D family protein [Phreatobacter sp.]